MQTATGRKFHLRLVNLALLLVLLLSACGHSSAKKHTPTPTATATPAPAPPSSQDLIAAALKTGRISYGTSLVYRAYALFGDSRLPSEYQGAGAFPEDDELFTAIHHDWNTLPADVQSLLHPFVVRPTSHESFFNTTPPTQTPLGAAQASSRFVASLGTSSARPASVTCDQNDWTATLSPHDYAFTVWAKCGSDPQGAAKDTNTVALMLDSLWPQMTALMGQPLPDISNTDPAYDPAFGDRNDGNNNSNIDIYLVSPHLVVYHIGGDETELGSFFGVTSATDHKPGIAAPPYASSAFMLIDRAALTDPAKSPLFKSKLCHEFFHVLQAAHNSAPGGYGQEKHWFVEASAVWAETHFVRSTSSLVHTDEFGQFQASGYTQKLECNDDECFYHQYQAYIWPYFMEQELGAASIASAWKALEAVNPADPNAPEESDVVIDAQLPFKDNFYLFALRNLDTLFQEGGPVEPQYTELDPGFPKNVMPDGMTGPGHGESLDALKTGAPPIPVSVTIPSLSARYFHYAPAPNVQQVTFDFSGVTPFDDLDIDLVINTGGKWTTQHETGNKTFKLCFSDAKGKHVDDIYLVLSNHNLVRSSTIGGTFTIKPLDRPCGCDSVVQVATEQGWQGTVSFSYQQSSGGNSANHTANVTVRYDLVEAPSLGDYALDASSIVGSAGENDEVTTDSGSITQTGSGPTLAAGWPPNDKALPGQHVPPMPAPPSNPPGNLSSGLIDITSPACTYEFTVALTMPVVSSGPNGSYSLVDLVGTASVTNVQSNDDPSLKGTADVQVYCSEPVQSEEVLLVNTIAFCQQDQGGERLGPGHLTWDLEPIGSPTPSPSGG